MATHQPIEKKKLSKGVITLLVLAVMCVLGIPCVGILAAVGLPAFIGYVRRSKVAEAQTNVHVLGLAVRDYCERNGRLPPSAGPLPAYATSEKQLVDFNADPVFAELGFVVADPVLYSYSIVPELDGSVSVRAEGDLDGDGALSRFSTTCYSTCGCVDQPTLDEFE